MRQEKGQDIAGACGQLALVNPGSSKSATDAAKHAAEHGHNHDHNHSHDIEDFAGNAPIGKQQLQQHRKRGVASSSVAAGKVTDKKGNSTATIHGSDEVASGVSANSSVNRCKMYCYVNVAIPLAAIASLYLFKHV